MAALDPAELLPATGPTACPANADRRRGARRGRPAQAAAAAIDYDDMLTRLESALAGSSDAAQRLRARYRVVLVDEFQDTDPVQWSILRRTFHGHTTLVLIGDPKQAIYAFRGADVVTYLDATRAADHHATLGVNHRSAAPLLDALHTVFGGAALGDERIRVLPVEPRTTGDWSTGGAGAAAGGAAGRADGDQERHRLDRPARSVARDLADRVVSLLSGEAGVQPRDGGDGAGQPATSRCWCGRAPRAQLVQTQLHAPACPSC